MEPAAPRKKTAFTGWALICSFSFREREPEGRPQVLMVGASRAKKGFHFGIRAFAGALKAGATHSCALLGDGAQRAQLEKTCTGNCIASRVTFRARFRTPRYVPPCSSPCCCWRQCAAPNIDRESGLIVAKEASAVGLPVVAHWHGGLPDIVEDGITGFLVPERDVARMAERLAALLRNPSMRSAFGRAAREKLEREYDICKANARLESFYDEAIALWNGRRPS